LSISVCFYTSPTVTLSIECIKARSHPAYGEPLTDKSPCLSPSFLPSSFLFSCVQVSKVVHRATVLVVAPDVRPSPTAHIKPVRVLQSVLHTAAAVGVPVVFALSRRGIGTVYGREKSMSIVAVMNLDQAEAEAAAMLQLASHGRAMYTARLASTYPPS
jgi:ribosomal protein L7Ae-like RNA K-turn-binding protein